MTRLISTCALLLAACSGEKTSAPPAIATITLIVPSTTMQVGQTQQLTAVLKSSTGETLTGREVTWSSSDVTIATVSATGLVSAIKPSNYAVMITATSEGKTGTSSITLTPGPLATVQVTLKDSVIVMGKTTTAAVVFKDSAGNAISNIPVTYATSDTDVAIITGAGTITGMYEGAFTIRASANGKSGFATGRVLLDPSRSDAFWKPLNYGLDLSYYLSAINGASIIPLAVDVNRDGKQDLVIHFWHMRTALEQNTLPLNAPVPNRLAVFLSNGDGSFRDATQEILGSRDVDLGGAVSRFVRAYDVNGDGFADWVYATNREDGRPCCASWKAQYAAVISNGNGTYRTAIFGDPSYHHGLALVPVGINVDLTGSGVREDASGRLTNEAYAFAQGSFRQVEGYPLIGSMSPVVLNLGQTSATTHLIYNRGAVNGPSPLLIARRSGIRTWTDQDSISFNSTLKWVNWISWNGDYCERCQFLWSENGSDFVSLDYIDGCSHRSQPDKQPIAVISRNTLRIIGGAKERTTFREGEGMEFFNRILTYSIVNDHFAPVSIIAESEQPTSDQYTDIECRDVNADGSGDIVVYSLHKPPRIYLNDGNSQLRRVFDGLLPASRTDSPSTWQGILLDVDGDGILDLTYFPRGYCNTGQACAKMQIHKGRRQLQTPGAVPSTLAKAKP